MRYFERHRIEWLQIHVQTVGHFQRADITSKFQISVPQASKDIATYKRLTKKWQMPKIIYNSTLKRYERAIGVPTPPKPENA